MSHPPEDYEHLLGCDTTVARQYLLQRLRLSVQPLLPAAFDVAAPTSAAASCQCCAAG
jgi:hypothetical protein